MNKYNLPKSVQHINKSILQRVLFCVKIYAELAGNCKKQRIKSLCDNNMTGEHALNGDGRKGWWVYVEGQESGKGGKTYSTKEEADQTVAYLRSQGLEAYSTDGIDPNRPLHRAFQSGRSVVERIFEAKLKGMG